MAHHPQSLNGCRRFPLDVKDGSNTGPPTESVIQTETVTQCRRCKESAHEETERS